MTPVNSPYKSYWFQPLATVFLRRGWGGRVLEEDLEALEKRSWTRGGSSFWKPLAEAIRTKRVGTVAEAVAYNRAGEIDYWSARQLVLQAIADAWRDSAIAQRDFELDARSPILRYEEHTAEMFPGLRSWVTIQVIRRMLGFMPDTVPGLKSLVALQLDRLEPLTSESIALGNPERRAEVQAATSQIFAAYREATGDERITRTPITIYLNIVSLLDGAFDVYPGSSRSFGWTTLTSPVIRAITEGMMRMESAGDPFVGARYYDVLLSRENPALREAINLTIATAHDAIQSYPDWG